jgi:hypothetical protein
MESHAPGRVFSKKSGAMIFFHENRSRERMGAVGGENERPSKQKMSTGRFLK